MNIPIYDAFLLYYKKPFGAIKQLDACRFRLKFPVDKNIGQPSLVMFRPGCKEQYIQMFHEETNDSFNIFSCVYTPQNTGVYQYYFFAVENGNRVFIKRKNASQGDFNGNELFHLTVYDKELSTPDWLKGGVMYQIFPDRFANLKDENDDSVIPIGRTFHNNWHNPPDWWPNEHGIVTNSDFFGGNLAGINSKLPYLQSLGITCIYLNPIFESHENHRYSTANYERIDPMLGNEKDFRQLCAAAKKHGIRIILDGVFSHTGADSIYFNKFGRYGEKKGAFRDPESPYREWYSFSNYPHVYDSWWGFDTLPNVNENNPSYTEYICGKDGILQKWLDAGASGWRLDVVDELPDEFIDNIYKAVKEKGEDKVVYGEVWEDATTKESYGTRRRYLIGGQLDSVMNYPFKELIIKYIKHSDSTSFRDGIMTILEHYPKPSVDILMNFLSTHDIERAITRLAGEPVGDNKREWQAIHQLTNEQYIYGRALLKCAMVLQFFLPGVPCVYYGDEAGTEGYKDPFNRHTYQWGFEDDNIIGFVQELSEIRRKNAVFKDGRLILSEVEPNHCIFARENGKEAVIIYLNKSKKTLRFKFDHIEGISDFKWVRSEAKNREPGQIKVPPYDYEVIRVKISKEKEVGRYE
ncbi:MAG: glycoside hydrolase family 13 protein [Eubacterium sp.]|jgi:glycosidase|nr:glycoside hydrolase family 13 protein [Eubacterium sp.]